MRLSSLLPVAASLAISSLAFGQTFQCPGGPAATCNDTTTSLGTFIINVSPAFQPVFAGASVPGYDPVSHIYVSPILYDPSTTIGRSAPFPNPGGPVSGVNIGTGPGSLTGQSTPGALPPGFSQTAGNDTILTALLNMSLSGGGITVTANTTGGAPGGNSLGEVQANQSTVDFPATSFFDVFVDISLPGGLGTFSNSTPLLVENTDLMSLPPMVIYTHMGSLGSVPLVGDNGGPFAGDTIGTILLSGHGVGYNNNQSSEQSFEGQIEADAAADNLTPEELNFIDNYINSEDAPEPATWVMLAGGLALVIARRRIF